MNKPRILVYVSNPDNEILKEICAGIEEEGVYFEVVERQDEDINNLSYESALDSILGTGIGICNNSIALSLSSLPKGKNVFLLEHPSIIQARSLGANAARVVKRLPFKIG